MGNVRSSYIANCAIATLCAVAFFCLAGNVKAAEVRNSGASDAVQEEPAAAGSLLFASDGEAVAVMPDESEGSEFGERGEFEEPEQYGSRGYEYEEPEEHEYGEREFQGREEEFPDEEFFGWPGDEFYQAPDEEFFEGPENFFEAPEDDFIAGPSNEIYQQHEEFEHPNQYFE